MKIVHADLRSQRGSLFHWGRRLRSKVEVAGLAPKLNQLSVSYKVSLETKVCSPHQTLSFQE